MTPPDGGAATRHPQDPDTVADTKAVAAFCLGVLGATTGLALAGVVPATIALVLARQAEAELVAGQGWRTGDHYLVWARRLAWSGLGLAAVALVLFVIVQLVNAGSGGHQDYPPTVD